MLRRTDAALATLIVGLVIYHGYLAVGANTVWRVATAIEERREAELRELDRALALLDRAPDRLGRDGPGVGGPPTMPP